MLGSLVHREHAAILCADFVQYLRRERCEFHRRNVCDFNMHFILAGVMWSSTGRFFKRVLADAHSYEAGCA